MEKRLLALFLAFVMILPMTCISASAVESNSEQEQMGILFYGPDKIRIRAQLSDLMVFVNAPDGDAREQALCDLISAPANEVAEFDDIPFEIVTGDTDYVGKEAISTRSPGTWNISAFTISAGAYTYIAPSGGTGFDVAYNETVSLTYYCSPDRAISVMCETSVPSTFYDPDYYSGTTTLWYPGVSGQYRIYLKNYSTASASITGGTVKIY